MKRLTDAQAAVLAALVQAEDESKARYRAFSGASARQIARIVWPDDPGWEKWTAGRGATSFNGCKGGTMPLRAGRVLSRLADIRDDDGYLLVDDDGDRRWFITDAGRRALDARKAA